MTELTLLASIPEHWDFRHTSLHLAYVVQGIEPIEPHHSPPSALTLWWQGILVPFLPGTEVLEPAVLLSTCASSHRFLSLSASALHL